MVTEWPLMEINPLNVTVTGKSNNRNIIITEISVIETVHALV